MISKKNRFIILFSIEIFLVSLSGVGFFYGLSGYFLFHSNTLHISIFSSVVLFFAGIYLIMDINIMFLPLDIRHNEIPLYHKPAKYYLFPPRHYFSNIKKQNLALKTPIDTPFEYNNSIFCYFHAQYYDILKEQMEYYYCKGCPLENGFCIFHQEGKTFHKDIETFNELNNKINNLIDEEKEVFCIGYNIPFISVTGKVIKKPIYLHDAKINIVDFRGSIFTDKAIGYFINSVFEEASFESVVFHKVLFNNSKFTRESKRQGFFHKWGKDYDLKRKFSGYVDFRNSKFYDQANFNSTEFDGIVLFDASEFFDDAIFINSRFYIENRIPLDNASFHGEFISNGMSIGSNIIPTGE